MDRERQGFEPRNIRPLGEKSQQENRSRTPRRQNHHQGNAETQQGKRKNLGGFVNMMGEVSPRYPSAVRQRKVPEPAEGPLPPRLGALPLKPRTAEEKR